MSRESNNNVRRLRPRLSSVGKASSAGSTDDLPKSSAAVIDFVRPSGSSSGARLVNEAEEMQLHTHESKATETRTPFFHLHLDNLNAEEALAFCDDSFAGEQTRSVFFINAHCFNVSIDDKDYVKALRSCDLLLNDGVGVRIASRLEDIDLKENMNGTDFIPKVLQLAARRGEGVFLLGAKPGVAELAKANLENRISGLEVKGTNDGYFSADQEAEVIEKVNNSRASVVVVGLGVPAQEKWVTRNKSRFTHAKIVLAGGAIIDFSAGRVRRAPQIMRKLGLEWLFRLAQEPGRLFSRYVVGNVRFLWLVSSQKLASYRR